MNINKKMNEYINYFKARVTNLDLFAIKHTLSDIWNFYPRKIKNIGLN
jgi:hypothetical protein